jgi:hypothetical protein
MYVDKAPFKLSFLQWEDFRVFLYCSIIKNIAL